MILERGVKVGLGKMSRIAGLRKQTEVRELQPFDHGGFAVQGGRFGLFPVTGMGKNEAQQQDLEKEEPQEDIGSSHTGHHGALHRCFPL